MITNIIEIELLPADRVVTRPVHQWDIGQIIKVTDAEIEDGTPVDFGNRFMKGGLRAYVVNNQVTIPAPALQQERDLTGYVVITDENSETTVKEIAIPVIARPKPEDYVDEEIRESTEFQYVLLAVEGVEANAQAAVESARKAADSEVAAGNAATAAGNAAAAAAGSANNAAGSATDAAAHKEAASKAADTATEKATEAGNSADAAKTSQNEAEKAKSDAESARDAAKTSEDNAKSHQESAGAAATNAGNSAKAASDSEQAAKDAAGTAGNKATEATNAAAEALNSKNAAGTSEANAGNSAKAAADSEAAAKEAQEAAKKSAEEISSGNYAKKIEVALYITPEQYGAVGDGVTDDSTAIQQAIDKAGKTAIVYLGCKTYKISTGLQITHSGYKFICDGTISYTGTDSAITIGSHTISVDVDTITAPNGTAILVRGDNKYIERCNINVRQITSSVIGLHVYTNTVSITYNKFKIGYIASTETGILVHCDASYINENWYWLGKISGCNTGIKLMSNHSLDTTAGFGTNNNRFYSGGLEGINTGGCAIHLDHTSGNKFEKLRCEEHYGENMVVFEGVCIRNDIWLSCMCLEDIDITNMDSGSSRNVLRSTLIMNHFYGYSLGQTAIVDSAFGISYDTRNAYIEYEVKSATFPNNTIKPLNVLIPTTLHFQEEAINGKTFVLGDIYSHRTSMATGFPVVMFFGESGGKILLTDVLGNTILDNTNGKYAGKLVSVRWNGYDKFDAIHVWDIQVIGENYLTEHQDISGKANKSDAEEWTFTLSDGSTVTKKVVLA